MLVFRGCTFYAQKKKHTNSNQFHPQKEKVSHFLGGWKMDDFLLTSKRELFFGPLKLQMCCPKDPDPRNYGNTNDKRPSV